MWLVSTFEKIYFKKIFFVSTFLDWYNFRNVKRVLYRIIHYSECVLLGFSGIIILRIIK